jgi:hypothetical protein
MRKTIKRKRVRSRRLPTDAEAFQRLLDPKFFGYTRMAIARMLGITKQAITRWHAVPLKHVKKLSEATGIPKHLLRPSDFA